MWSSTYSCPKTQLHHQQHKFLQAYLRYLPTSHFSRVSLFFRRVIDCKMYMTSCYLHDYIKGVQAFRLNMLYVAKAGLATVTESGWKSFLCGFEVLIVFIYNTPKQNLKYQHLSSNVHVKDHNNGGRFPSWPQSETSETFRRLITSSLASAEAKCSLKNNQTLTLW